MKMITNSNLRSHGLSFKEYVDKYPYSETSTPEVKAKLKSRDVNKNRKG